MKITHKLRSVNIKYMFLSVKPQTNLKLWSADASAHVPHCSA